MERMERHSGLRRPPVENESIGLCGVEGARSVKRRRGCTGRPPSLFAWILDIPIIADMRERG
jgi:hypothetical protein